MWLIIAIVAIVSVSTQDEQAEQVMGDAYILAGYCDRQKPVIFVNGNRINYDCHNPSIARVFN